MCHAYQTAYTIKHVFIECIYIVSTRQIFYNVLQCILEGVRTKNLQATILFVDFAKAFDSIQRGKIEQILLAHGLPKETVAAIMMLYRNTKVKVCSDGDTDYFDILGGVLLGDTLAPYLFIMSIDKRQWFQANK